ncbi:MAG: hypothetical protein J6Q49_07250 [Kiritimatiellae bacterium]|nr:hypothetical protein [Kiritimatiellia bacterium]
MVRRLLTVVALAAGTFAVAEDESVSASSSEAAFVDTRGGDARVIGGSADVGYSPSWCSVTNDGAYVKIEKVVHADMFNAVTSTVATLSPDTSGTHDFTLVAAEAPCVRLLHRVYSSGGEELGNALVRDLAFGCEASSAAAASVDCREDSLQLVVDADGVAELVYDTSWDSQAANVTLSTVQLTDGSGNAVVPVTNVFLTAAADASDVVRKASFRFGGWRFLCTLSDASGNVLGEPYSADYFKKGGGFFLIVR